MNWRSIFGKGVIGGKEMLPDAARTLTVLNGALLVTVGVGIYVLTFISVAGPTSAEWARGLVAGVASGFAAPLLSALRSGQLIKPRLVWTFAVLLAMPPVTSLLVLVASQPHADGFARGAFATWIVATGLPMLGHPEAYPPRR